MRKLDVVASEEDARAALAEVRRDTRRVREAVPARMRLADEPLERLHRIAAQRAGKTPTPSPDALAPVRPGQQPPAPSPLRLAGEDTPPPVGGFGYYSQFANDDAIDGDDLKAVNE